MTDRATKNQRQIDAPLPQIGDRSLVTFVHPIWVLINGGPRRIHAIEGELSNTSDQVAVFRCLRLFAVQTRQPGRSAVETFTMRTTMTTHLTNIAGMVPVPPPEPPLREKP